MRSQPFDLTRAPVTAYSYYLPKGGEALKAIGLIQGTSALYLQLQAGKTLTLNVDDAFTFARGGALKMVMAALARGQVETALSGKMSRDGSPAASITSLSFGRDEAFADALTVQTKAKLVDELPTVVVNGVRMKLLAHKEAFGAAAPEINRALKIAAEAQSPARFIGIAKDGVFFVTSATMSVPT